MRVPVLCTLLLVAIGVAISCVPDFSFPPGGSGGTGSGGSAGTPSVAGSVSAGASGASTATCNDGILNGTESDTDCGGECEEKCDSGLRCTVNADCEIGSCHRTVCQATHCTDEVRNEGESAVDCGSYDCPKCGVGQPCTKPEHCRSNACDVDTATKEGTCIPSGCDDEVLGGAETDLNCGGDTFCPRCGVNKRCMVQGDCETAICIDSRCTTAECVNEEKDEGEEQIDCGGSCPKACTPDVDCKDGRLNGLETDRDCGGGLCDPCPDGKNCTGDDDCLSEHCYDSKCSPEACREDPEDCMPNGGSGGTSGNGGSSNGGTGGTGGEGGASEQGGTSQGGTAGAQAGGSAGSGGAPPLTSCPGCARLVVPLSAANQIANYVILLSGPYNFERGKIVYRIYKESGRGGSVKGYVQYGGNPDFRQVFQSGGKQLNELLGWTELTWDVGAQEMTNFSKSNVSRIGLQVTAGAEGPWSETVVYVDSIQIEDVAGSSGAVEWTFDRSSSISTSTGGYPAANLFWRNIYDNPVAGSLLEWLGGAE